MLSAVKKKLSRKKSPLRCYLNCWSDTCILLENVEPIAIEYVRIPLKYLVWNDSWPNGQVKIISDDQPAPTCSTCSCNESAHRQIESLFRFADDSVLLKFFLTHRILFLSATQIVIENSGAFYGASVFLSHNRDCSGITPGFSDFLDLFQIIEILVGCEEKRRRRRIWETI